MYQTDSIFYRLLNSILTGYIRRRLHHLVDVGATLQVVGPVPDAETLRRVVEEDASVAGPDDAPGRAGHRRAADRLGALGRLLLLRHVLVLGARLTTARVKTG